MSAIQKVSQAYSRLEQQYERPPSNDEIGELLESNAESVGDLICVCPEAGLGRRAT